MGGPVIRAYDHMPEGKGKSVEGSGCGRVSGASGALTLGPFLGESARLGYEDTRKIGKLGHFRGCGAGRCSHNRQLSPPSGSHSSSSHPLGAWIPGAGYREQARRARPIRSSATAPPCRNSCPAREEIDDGPHADISGQPKSSSARAGANPSPDDVFADNFFFF